MVINKFMRLNYLKLLCFLFILTQISFCKKNENTNWDIDLSSPLAFGKLTLVNIIPDSLFEINALTNEVNLKFSQKIIELNLDTLLEIPDTSIFNSLKPLFSFTCPANTNVIPTVTNDINFYANNVELSLIKIESGKVNISLISNIQGVLKYTYSIPGATLNNVPLIVEITIPSAPISGSIEVQKEIDLTGYNLDLTGTSGNEYNKLSSVLTVQTADLPVSVNVSQDSVYSTNTFSVIVPEYAKGYLGSISESFDMENVDFSISNSISGMIDFDQVYIDFDIENGFGVDARLNINTLASVNNQTGLTINLESDFIGNSLNLNRAIDLGNSFTSSNYNLNFNHTNSNIDAFIGNLPTQLGYDLDIEINPLGNISNYNDFVYESSKVEATMNINIPLKFSTNGLVVSDTVAFQKIQSNNDSEENTNKINFGKLFIEVKNTFPFSATVELNLLDNGANSLQSIGGIIIASGQYNTLNSTTTSNTNLIVIEATQELLDNLLTTENMALKATFNTYDSGTNGIVSISSDASIEFKISGELNYNVTLK